MARMMSAMGILLQATKPAAVTAKTAPASPPAAPAAAAARTALWRRRLHI